MEKEYYFNAEISPQFNFQPFGNVFHTNPNFEDPMEQCSQYETALSSMVSSPSASNSVIDHFAVRELFGKLGNVDISPELMQRSSYMNSPNTSCYNTPIDSPPEPIMNTFVKENMPMTSALPALPTDQGFAKRAAKFSCFGSHSLNGRPTPIGINNAEFHYRNSRQLMGITSLPRVSSSPSLNADGSPMVLVNNVHAAAGRESKLRISWKKVVDKINGAYGSLLTPIQRGSGTTIAKVESKAVVADTEGGRRVRRRSLFSKEKKNESGFVAYSADYSRPRHHPPKNN